MNHPTKLKGDLGVLKAKADICSQGFMVLSPETEHAPFDIVAYDGSRFIRIQVKYRAITNGKIDVPCKTSWADRNGTHQNIYDQEVLDVFCVYVPDLDMCFYFSHKLFIGKTSSLTFRVEQNQNGTARLVKDYLLLQDAVNLKGDNE